MVVHRGSWSVKVDKPQTTNLLHQPTIQSKVFLTHWNLAPVHLDFMFILSATGVPGGLSRYKFLHQYTVNLLFVTSGFSFHTHTKTRLPLCLLHFPPPSPLPVSYSTNASGGTVSVLAIHSKVVLPAAILHISNYPWEQGEFCVVGEERLLNDGELFYRTSHRILFYFAWTILLSVPAACRRHIYIRWFSFK